MKLLLEKLHSSAIAKINGANSIDELTELRVKYLGKKGELTSLLKQMGGLSAEERPIIGQISNNIKNSIEEILSQKEIKLGELLLSQQLKQEAIDVSIPGRKTDLGNKHPLSIVLKEIENIFLGMGFQIASGPEIEYDYYNFDALNIPKDHPSRDVQDTFYITDNILLRTQTSSVQIRVMENKKPPIKIIVPGRVYRSDAVDATHSPMFHQVEGLVVDKGISMSDLKGTLELFLKNLYGEDMSIRLRPHHFPFTEPSAEVDITCFVCKGKGCKVCKGEGYIEILGAGMVHPKVLQTCGIDPDIYSGFAFGMGLDRIVMRKFNIDDLRLLYENDVRFLSQF